MEDRNALVRRTARVARGVVPLVAAAFLAATSCEDPLTVEQDYARAEQAVERWIAENPDGWELDLGPWPLKRAAGSQPCAQTPASGTVVLQFAVAETEIDLHFRCPLGASATEQDLNEAFAFATLKRMPVDLYAFGWEVDLQTIPNPVLEGIFFSIPVPGQLVVEIRMPLYGIYALSTRAACRRAADPLAEPLCAVVREHRIPMRWRFSAAFTGSVLE